MKWELKYVLFRRGIKIYELADHLGVSTRTVSRLVNSEKMPSIGQEKIEAIAKYIGCPVSEILVMEESDFKSTASRRRRRKAA